MSKAHAAWIHMLALLEATLTSGGVFLEHHLELAHPSRHNQAPLVVFDFTDLSQHPNVREWRLVVAGGRS